MTTIRSKMGKEQDTEKMNNCDQHSWSKQVNGSASETPSVQFYPPQGLEVCKKSELNRNVKVMELRSLTSSSPPKDQAMAGNGLGLVPRNLEWENITSTGKASSNLMPGMALRKLKGLTLHNLQGMAPRNFILRSLETIPQFILGQ